MKEANQRGQRSPSIDRTSKSVNRRGMSEDPKQVVAAAYDLIADAYLSKYGASSVRAKWLERLLASLADRRCNVLDLGCGAGLPVAKTLIDAGHAVSGVDSSFEQIARARGAVPGATFAQADMTDIRFEMNAFDVVSAFYSITHVPADEQAGLFEKIWMWLKPGGTFVASLGSGIAGDWSGDWMGARNFFSHNSETTSLTLIKGAGFDVRAADVERQDNEDVSFLWILAVKPQDALD